MDNISLDSQNGLTAIIAESLLQHKISGQKLGAILQEIKTKPGDPRYSIKAASVEQMQRLSSQAANVTATLCKLADGENITEDEKKNLNVLGSLLAVIEAGMIQKYCEDHDPHKDDIRGVYSPKHKRFIRYQMYNKLDDAQGKKLIEGAVNKSDITEISNPDEGLPNARAKLLALAHSIGTYVKFDKLHKQGGQAR